MRRPFCNRRTFLGKAVVGAVSLAAIPGLSGMAEARHRCFGGRRRFRGYGCYGGGYGCYGGGYGCYGGGYGCYGGGYVSVSSSSFGCGCYGGGYRTGYRGRPYASYRRETYYRGEPIYNGTRLDYVEPVPPAEPGPAPGETPSPPATGPEASRPTRSSTLSLLER